MVIGGKRRSNALGMLTAVEAADPPTCFVSALVAASGPAYGGAVANRLGDKSLGRLLMELTLMISGT